MTDLAPTRDHVIRLEALRRQRARVTAALLVAVVAAMFVLAVGAGPLQIAPGKVITILTGDPAGWSGGVSASEMVVVRSVRLPRALMVGLTGAALGVAGVLMQGLFRNPLADPGLIGISSGAGLAAAIVIVVGDRWLGAASLPFALLPAGAFIGAMAVTALLYGLATRGGRTAIATLLLAGIAVGALAASGTGMLIFMADDRQLRDITFWMLGSFGGVTWGKLAIAAPLLVLPVLAGPALARALDALALGEAEAWHLGIAVQRTKIMAMILTALGVGASVAVAGVVSFVGIVVPHVARLLVGPVHRGLIPAAALFGAALLLLADTAARLLAAPAELPLGILTAAIGAPVFLHLLLSHQKADLG